MSSVDARRIRLEWLDLLPEAHPALPRLRSDLRRLNRFLGTEGWFRRCLRAEWRAGDTVVELAAGDGALARALTRALPALRGHYTAQDCAPLDAEALGRSGVATLRSDLLDGRGWPGHSVVLANLILHQFSAAELRQLGACIDDSAARLLLIQEPARNRRARALVACGRVIGLKRETRFDATASVASGFRANELPALLGLPGTRWRWHCRETWRGSWRGILWRKQL